MNQDIILTSYTMDPFFPGLEEIQTPVSLRTASLIAADTNK